MDIQDYSRKYAVDKKALQKTAEEMRKTYDSNVDQLEKSHKNKRDVERGNTEKVFRKVKTENEAAYSSQAKKSKDVLRKTKEEFVKRINDEKVDHEKKSNC